MEKFDNAENKQSSEVMFSEKDIEEAKGNLEKLANRLDELWVKEEPLTPSEQKEVDIILNNSIIIQEALEGKQSPEFEQWAN
tara:strand:- start:3455 stop:3700 length:246 start_codon:yes stop_codon:yes gene_type:complete